MAEIKIGRMVLGAFATNTYFLYREGGHSAIVVDPADYGEHIYHTLKKNGLQVAAIFLTHGHADHIWGTKDLKQAAGEDGPVKIYACEAEKEFMGDTRMNLSKAFGRPYTLEADVYLKDGEEFTVAGMDCKMIATPGHTIGGCCYYFEEAGFLISGDTLFLESTGRTDFATGSMSTLVRSIKEKLFLLPDSTKVYPGHGDSTTIGYEKVNNPFCA
ncbi:MAG: MBL fold metallo-hydrolase [Roseburia sp.]|nr:MBL fold metallo-hydrolase [Roseburia sp.]